MFLEELFGGVSFFGFPGFFFLFGVGVVAAGGGKVVVVVDGSPAAVFLFAGDLVGWRFTTQHNCLLFYI